MISEKQLVANRENAKKGGPKTKEGKEIVRLNALKHGLFVDDLSLASEDSKVLKAIWDGLIVELKPEGILEEMLIVGIVSNFWRRQMAIRLETDYLSEQFTKAEIAYDQGDFEAWSKFVNRELANNKGWQNLTRYHTSFENKFYKGIHELQRQQMPRRGATVPPPLAVDVDISKEG